MKTYGLDEGPTVYIFGRNKKNNRSCECFLEKKETKWWHSICTIVQVDLVNPLKTE